MKFNYRKELLDLIVRLLSNGCLLLTVDNGENAVGLKPDFVQSDFNFFIDEAMACDEASLRVRLPGGEVATLFLVYGNDPGEIVCDYTVSPLLDRITDEHYESWTGYSLSKSTVTQ